jgi:hypothetical protein
MRAPHGVVGAALLAGCERPVPDRAEQKSGDQHVKTVIALIELHKTRYGAYPESLEGLRFVGDGTASPCGG